MQVLLEADGVSEGRRGKQGLGIGAWFVAIDKGLPCWMRTALMF